MTCIFMDRGELLERIREAVLENNRRQIYLCHPRNRCDGELFVLFMNYRSCVWCIGPAVAPRGHVKFCGGILGESGEEKLEKRVDVFASNCAAIDLGAII